MPGPAIVNINLFVRSLPTISDIKMVSIEVIFTGRTNLNVKFVVLRCRLKAVGFGFGVF